MADDNQTGRQEEISSNQIDEGKTGLKKVILEELEEEQKGRTLEKIENLSDVELPVRVEFARTKKKIKDILKIGEKDIIKLNRFAGEHVDIFVSEKLFARGEITVVDDKFGVRIVEILPPEEVIE